MKNKGGFAFLGLVIAIAVLAVIIAFVYLGKNNNGQTTIENQINDMQKAKDAAKLFETQQQGQQNVMDQVK